METVTDYRHFSKISLKKRKEKISEYVTAQWQKVTPQLNKTGQETGRDEQNINVGL